MNRKEFFKKLGLGALVVAVAPKVLAEKENGHLMTVSRTPDHEDTFKDGLLTNEEGIPYKCTSSYNVQSDSYDRLEPIMDHILKMDMHAQYLMNRGEITVADCLEYYKSVYKHTL